MKTIFTSAFHQQVVTFMVKLETDPIDFFGTEFNGVIYKYSSSGDHSSQFKYLGGF